VILRRALLGSTLALSLPRSAAAQAPVTLLVGAAEGSAADLAARSFAPFLERHLPRAGVSVLDRPGEAGLVAYQALAEAGAQAGMTGWIATPSLPARTVERFGAARLMTQLRLVGAVEKEAICFVAAAHERLASAQDLLTRTGDAVAARPLATPPAGSPPHLAALRLQALTGTTLNIVDFPSAAAARQAALDGTAAAAALGLRDAIKELRSHRLSGLGVAPPGGAETLPDMPPLHDLGLMLGVCVRRGLAVPVATSEADVARLRAALLEVVADPEFRAQADGDGFLVDWMEGADWTARATVEREDLARLWQFGPWRTAGVG
jgi:tripartite-type tricarboxylate transporter receptor subunit TctC